MSESEVIRRDTLTVIALIRQRGGDPVDISRQELAEAGAYQLRAAFTSDGVQYRLIGGPNPKRQLISNDKESL